MIALPLLAMEGGALALFEVLIRRRGCLRIDASIARNCARPAPAAATTVPRLRTREGFASIALAARSHRRDGNGIQVAAALRSRSTQTRPGSWVIPPTHSREVALSGGEVRAVSVRNQPSLGSAARRACDEPLRGGAEPCSRNAGSTASCMLRRQQPSTSRRQLHGLTVPPCATAQRVVIMSEHAK